jgi:uroporphyrinogen-III synthase
MPEQPLAGLRVLVTRERGASEAFALELERLGAHPIICPALEVQFRNPPGLDEALMALGRFDWLVLTSANAVRALGRRFQALGLDAGRTLAAVSIGVVGAATEAALAELGGQARLVAQPANAANLAQRLDATGVEGALVLFPAARMARSELPQRLRAAGAGVVQLAVYETLAPRELVVPAADQLDAATFTSPSAVRNVAEVVDAAWFISTPAICIGPLTLEAAGNAGVSHALVAAEASMAGMLAALKEFSQQREQVGSYGTG